MSFQHTNPQPNLQCISHDLTCKTISLRQAILSLGDPYNKAVKKSKDVFQKHPVSWGKFLLSVCPGRLFKRYNSTQQNTALWKIQYLENHINGWKSDEVVFELKRHSNLETSGLHNKLIGLGKITSTQTHIFINFTNWILPLQYWIHLDVKYWI